MEKKKKEKSEEDKASVVSAILSTGPAAMGTYSGEGSSRGSGGRGRRRREMERDPFAGAGAGAGLGIPPTSYYPGRKGEPFSRGGSQRDDGSVDSDALRGGGPRRQRRGSRYEGSEARYR